jgi:hypothetical protein
MSRYEDSANWIRQQIKKHPKLEQDALKKHCSQNYPFGYRSGHAYRAFLKAMRDIFPANKTKTSSLKKRGTA